MGWPRNSDAETARLRPWCCQACQFVLLCPSSATINSFIPNLMFVSVALPEGHQGKADKTADSCVGVPPSRSTFHIALQRNISRVATCKAPTDREGSDAAHDDDAPCPCCYRGSGGRRLLKLQQAAVRPSPPFPQAPQSNSSCIKSRPDSDLGRPFPLAAFALGLVNGNHLHTAGTNYYYYCLSGVQFLLQEEGWRRRPHETLDSRQCQSAPA